MSLVQSCKQNQVEPWTYLKNAFDRRPSLGQSPSHTSLDELLPNHWLQNHPQHVWRIRQLRQQEG
ncbi:transposase domain-containing protein [Bremerella sp.]|uniref:transposase domain-containing protein n=1 Tax=Bremerella sp. TaxID=2795602 RepID=UPI00391CF702